jgi:hypothetical protein
VVSTPVFVVLSAPVFVAPDADVVDPSAGWADATPWPTTTAEPIPSARARPPIRYDDAITRSCLTVSLPLILPARDGRFDDFTDQIH